jgi:MarR family 2-MHQ and catechol resistance regulon transcriptional repressor
MSLTSNRYLGKRGLVKRQRDPQDQRYVRVTLTPAGRALVARILPTHVATIVADLSSLTTDEQDTLARLCRKVGLRRAEQP